MTGLTDCLSATQQFTALFHRGRAGDRLAANLAYSIAMPRLRAVAGALLRRHASHHTLQPTALVSELYLKLRGFSLRVANREHFFNLSAMAMHQVLIDRSRSKASRLPPALSIAGVDLPDHRALSHSDRNAVHGLLLRFEKIDGRAAGILRAHYLEGHTWDEISHRMGFSVGKVRNDAAFGLRWIRDQF